MAKGFRIGNREVGGDEPFVIAELGSNHQGSVEVAASLIQKAAEAGADAVKFQKRSNKDLYTKAYYESLYHSENAYGPTYGAHREALELDKGDFSDLKELADELRIEMFATAFDEPSVDFCHDLDLPAIKIASGDLTNTPLISYAMQTQRPLLVSTGAARIEDVDRAYKLLGSYQHVLMQCTATYPSQPEEQDLAVIANYAWRYPNSTLGLSSHHSGILMPVIGYVLGARVFEVHFTLNRAMRGTDHAFSLEPQGLRKLCRDLERTRVALGDGRKKFRLEEYPALQKMGKTLRFAHPLPAGHVLTGEDLCARSPGGEGFPPYEKDGLVGSRLFVAVDTDHPVTLEVLDVRQSEAV